jgi:tetratricopeptide (TPR) repeat protein
LDRNFKYYFNRLTVVGLLLILFSCKSKKEAKISDEKVRETIDQKIEAYNQILFAGKYVDGCSARMKGNLEEAKKLFSECKRINPNNNAVKYELATVYKILGVNDQALLNARACAQAEPKNEWYQLLLIACYNQLKQYNQSVKVREALVKNFPNKSEFKEDLAIEYAIIGQFDKAFKIYEELEKVFGINEQITLNKAKLLKSQRKFKEAEEELLRLSASNVDETKYYSFLADFYIEQNDLSKAKLMYDKIIAIEPNNPVVNLALHDYYSTQGRTAEAFECLKKAFQNPDLDVITKSNIANSFYERIEGKEGNLYKENGMELARIIVQVHPQTPEANAIYARFLTLDKKIKEAAEYFYKAAIKEKGNLAVWQGLLLTYNKLGRFDSLEHVSAIAIEHFPSSADLYFFNGYANIQLRNYKKAAQSLKDGLEFADNKLRMMDFYVNLGDAYFYGKEYEKSDKAFEDALKIDADNTFALNQYAYYLSLRKENLEKAEKLSKKTNDLSPENRKYMDTYGWILFQQKKYKEAELWLSGAVKLGPKDQTILEHYGDVLFKLNQTNEALRFWEDARSAGGNSEALLKKIKDKRLND